MNLNPKFAEELFDCLDTIRRFGLNEQLKDRLLRLTARIPYEAKNELANAN